MSHLLLILALLGQMHGPELAARARTGGRHYNLGEPRADYTSNLALWYTLDDAADGTITDSGPNGFHLTVTARGAFPTRTTVNGVGVRLFSRSTTTSTGSNADNYASTSITDVQYNALVGSGNGHSGDWTVAAWYNFPPTGTGEGTGLADFISITGGGVNAGTATDKQTGMVLNQFRSVASFGKLRGFWSVPPNTGAGLTATLGTSSSQWHHAVMVNRANVAGTSVFCDYYLDGVYVQTSASLSASFAQQGTLPANGRIAISAVMVPTDGTPVGQVGGYMRDIRFYTRALSALDIAALYAATR